MQRGQAIVETAVFLPLLLVSLFALIFFCRLGVLSERAESAVRYGQLVSFRQGAYTIGAVYELIDELLNPTADELGPLCLAPTLSTATPAPGNQVGTDVRAALTQSQTIGSSSGPSAKRFWQPDVTPALPNCQPFSVSLAPPSTVGTTGSSVSSLPLSVTGVSIQAQINTPAYLSSIITNNTTSAHINFLNVATPNALLACMPGLSAVLTILQPTLTGTQVGSVSQLCPASLP